MYTAKKPVFKPAFAVSSDVAVVQNKLQVFNGPTQLTPITDYTISVINNRVHITFVGAARFEDGIKFSARYAEDRVWLNPGTGTVTDGLGLAGSTTLSAEFVKSFPHILT